MSGEKDDMEDEADEDKAEEEMESVEPAIEETSEVEESSEEATEDKVEEGSEDELELDLDESEDDAEEEAKLDEYTKPETAKAGDNGEGASRMLIPCPMTIQMRQSKTHDGNTAGGKGEAKDMNTGNVNVSGNSKAIRNEG